MNTPHRSVAAPILLAIFGACALPACPGPPTGAQPTAEGEGHPIGIYDSRAVAVAAVDHPAFEAWHRALRADVEEAKAAGDEERVRDLEKKAVARQRKLHRQAFGTAPVDDILAWIEDDLPAVRQEAGVVALVSKWDEEALAEYPDSPRIDVTEQLVDALEPTREQRESAMAVMKHAPVPEWRLRAMSALD